MIRVVTDEPRLSDDMSDEERLALADFVAHTKEILNWVIHDPRSAVPKYLRLPLRDAWRVTDGRFSQLRSEIVSQNLDADLEAHGLTGNELKVKLTAFNAYYESWSNLLDKQEKRWWHRLVKTSSQTENSGS
jgi:hypothetical protein